MATSFIFYTAQDAYTLVFTYTEKMYCRSKTTSLTILGVTSILCSRLLFFFFDDLEGPNLLIVMVMAGFIYAVSLFVYTRNSFFPFLGLKRLLLTLVMQITTTFFLYLFLH